MPENGKADREGHLAIWGIGKKENAAPHYYLTSWSGLEMWSSKLNSTCRGEAEEVVCSRDDEESSKNSLWSRRTMKSPTKVGAFADTGQASGHM
ncbi:5-carboxymethyl-2-hydroxymuconate isomerase [Anopheles sinensis]|uniref:5-carboxymethyl-2-hydroxymuconate isomerase n=1 Tax=Anopheles sinensis TaxID=74873 RepID=A0A084WQC1_ANOSI|nr:5-carboxymethyl-2-hydroxymuconate isomerase [Anopheles sinensis]